MFVITKRDEDGTWYACKGAGGIITCWEMPRSFDTLIFHTEAYAQSIANRTTVHIRANAKEGYISGPCRVKEI